MDEKTRLATFFFFRIFRNKLNLKVDTSFSIQQKLAKALKNESHTPNLIKAPKEENLSNGLETLLDALETDNSIADKVEH